VEPANKSDRGQAKFVRGRVYLLTAAFERTIRHIFLHTPLTIIVSDTAINQASTYDLRGDAEMDCSVMVEKLEQVFDLECVPIQRSHWNRETGR
jgi:DNA mismatch repair protein MSH4